MDDILQQEQAVRLPVGYRDPASGEVYQEAAVRAANGGDEYYIGLSADYDRHPNDLIYKTLLLSRTVTRLGPRTLVSIEDIKNLHARDVRALEVAVYRLTYGEENIPEDAEESG